MLGLIVVITCHTGRKCNNNVKNVKSALHLYNAESANFGYV